MNPVKLLFVDDDLDDRELLNSCLLECRINEFIILESGEKALVYIGSLQEEQLPAVIVTDLNMPGMDGVEFINHLKSLERYQKIPVFLLTMSARNTRIDKAICYGAAGFYQKPASILEMRLLMQEIEQIASRE